MTVHSRLSYSMRHDRFLTIPHAHTLSEYPTRWNDREGCFLGGEATPGLWLKRRGNDQKFLRVLHLPIEIGHFFNMARTLDNPQILFRHT